MFSFFNRLALASATAGLAIATVLTLAHTSKIPLPCGGSNGCETVANDPSSIYLGIPISAYGMMAYLFLIALALLRINGVAVRTCSFVGLLLSLVGTLNSAFLTYHSITKIHATCIWCIGSACMMTLSTICYIATPRASLGIRDGGRPISALPWGLIPMVIIGLYAKFGGGSPIQEPVPDLSTVKYTKASLSALEKSSRALGPLKAPVSIVEFADLLCPACRSMHQSLLKFVARNKGKVRLLYHHFPLSKEKGHEDSQYAATLAEQFNDEDFWGFVSKVYESEEKPTRLDLDNIAAKFYGKKIRSMVQAGEAVVKEIKMGQDLGVTLTPTYIIFINRKPESVASSFNIKDVITQDKYVKIFNPSPKKKSTSSKGK